VASQVLEQFEVDAFHSSAVANAYAVPSWAPSVDDAAAFDEEADLLESKANGFRCAKGLMVALGLEASAALCFYGMWHLWHVLR
jgi:hypothetical protein